MIILALGVMAAVSIAMFRRTGAVIKRLVATHAVESKDARGHLDKKRD